MVSDHEHVQVLFGFLGQFLGVRMHQHLPAVHGQDQADVLRFGLDLVFGERLACHGQHGQPFRVEHRCRALRFLQVDQTVDQFRQSFGFLGDSAGEVFHRVRIVGRVADRFGEQRNRACQGFQFVRDVGDEIAPHDFETALLAHVGNENRK